MDMDMNIFSNPQGERTKLLKEIQRYNFAAYDLGLYLDTHPTDKRAIAMHKELIKKLENVTDEFEKQFGPLTMGANKSHDNWDWICDPWPWEE